LETRRDARGPRIRFYQPAERLRPYISSYYFTDLPGGGPVHDLLHPEWGNIRFILSGFWTAQLGDSVADSETTPATLYGPTSHCVKIVGHPPTGTMGVGLLPLGWAHLIGVPANAFSDRIRSLKDVFPDDTGRLLQGLRDAADDSAARKLLDDFFLALDAARPLPDPLLLQAHKLLVDPATLTAQQFAAGLGRSGRQVARLSLDMFGFPPKLLLRRQRFLRTLAVMRSRLDEPWAVLLDEAYYDQSHFVRDFQRFMGMSPTAYFSLPRLLLDPAARLRAAQIGQPLQGLHPVKGDTSS
jgi:AraC-like DNA-binding protein